MSNAKIDELLKAKEPAKDPVPPTPTPTPTPDPIAKEDFKLATEAEFEVALNHVTNINDEMVAKYAGKNGMNPFVWIKNNIEPLVEAYNKGDRTETLCKNLKSITMEEPNVSNIKVARWDMTKQLEIARQMREAEKKSKV